MNTFTETADSHETSQEIMDAIRSVAGSDEIAERVWADPTESEMIHIWEGVTKNGLIASTEFCWGAEGSQWAKSIEVSRA